MLLNTNTMNYTNQAMTPKQVVISCISRMINEYGKCALPNLGIALKERSITTKSLGVRKYSEYFEQDPDFALDEQKVYVSLASKANAPARPTIDLSNPTLPICLEQFAEVGWKEILLELSSIISPEEQWNVDSIKNYIKSQYSASRVEKRILFNREYAIFHSGLYTQDDDPIYAFIETINGRRMFKQFITKGRETATMSSIFGHLPKRATYGRAEDKYFDQSRFCIDSINFDHILDRYSRLPIDFQVQYAPDGFDKTLITKENEQDEYNKAFKAALVNDRQSRDAIEDRLTGSVRRALRRIEETPSEMVLGYNYKHANLVHLMPLDINGDGVVDCALVIINQGDSYYAPTIITLDMARCSARTIGKITAEWLKK